MNPSPCATPSRLSEAARSRSLPSYVETLRVGSGARVGTWPTLATALDPRALVDNHGDYAALGFLATHNASASGQSFDVTVVLKVPSNQVSHP